MKTNKILYQWDAGQKLTDCRGVFVDFVISGEVYRCDVVNGECIVPDELLQHPGKQTAYECMADSTLQEFVFSVVPRPLPPDYVYTPTEKLTFEGLVQKVDDTVADIIRRADSGEFDGYTPVKGKDYFTESEKNEMMQRVSDGAIGEFREVVDSATTEYNANAAEKLTAYDTNAEQHTTDYNRNAAEKLEAYNQNHTEKVAEYNQNAENKTAEFDANAAAMQTEVDRLRGECDNLAEENRKQENRIDALMKLNKGQTYDIVPEEGEAASRTAPSGAKYVSVDKVGGKSVVWNQLCNPDEFVPVDCTQTESGGVVTISDCRETNRYAAVFVAVTKGHKYYQTVKIKSDGTNPVGFQNYLFLDINTKTTSAEFIRLSKVAEAKESGNALIQLWSVNGTDYQIVKNSLMLFDLTLMFGAGNEPTAEQFEAMFPAEYYPYCEPTIISSQTDRVDVKSSNLIYPNMPFIDRSGYTSSGVTYTYDENRVITINGTRAENVSGSLGLFYYSALDNGKYTLSVYDEYGNYASDVNINVNVRPPYTFVVADSNRNSLITIAASISGKKYNNTKYYIKLEKGAKSTPYNPHIMQQITTNFPVLNSAGSAYDYIDLNEGKLNRRVGKVDLGTLNWNYSTVDAIPKFSSSGISGAIKKVESYTSVGKFICTKYAVGDWLTAFGTGTYNLLATNPSGIIAVGDSDYTDAAAFKEAMQGVMLYYELADEIVTDIEIPAELTDWIEVEAGGSVIFHNSDETKQLAVPNAVSWVRKLDEVN